LKPISLGKKEELISAMLSLSLSLAGLAVIAGNQEIGKRRLMRI
jgi:hypothetical protein